MVVFQSAKQNITALIQSLSINAGSGSEFIATNAVILKDSSGLLQKWENISASIDQLSLNTTIIDLPLGNGYGINFEGNNGTPFEYNRLYILNSNGVEIIRAKLDTLIETEINIDVSIQMSEDDSIEIVNS